MGHRCPMALDVERPGGGAWLKTFTGRKFYPLNPKHEDVDILDIAHSLSLQCRFAGHTRKFYSVAEHSVRVSYEVPDSLAMEALLHDASEAYLVDIPRPVKPYLTGYNGAEQALMNVIMAIFGLHPMRSASFPNFQMHNRVRWADDKLLAIEALSLMEGPFEEWNLSYRHPIQDSELITDPAGPAASEQLFLDRFEELNGKTALMRAWKEAERHPGAVL